MSDRLIKDNLQTGLGSNISFAKLVLKPCFFEYFWLVKLRDGTVLTQFDADGTEHVMSERVMIEAELGNIESAHWIPLNDSLESIGYRFEKGDILAKRVGIYAQGYIANTNRHKGHVYFLGRKLENGEFDLVVFDRTGTIKFTNDINRVWIK